jgi:glycosyltransferase involved in cell wall biosynthesis
VGKVTAMASDIAAGGGPARDSLGAVPLLGIGLPVYNGERYLPEALDSLLAQEFRDFEILVSDNASTDGTEAICRAYAARDPRVRYFRNDGNIGVNANFERAFELSRSPLFRWAACDDVVAPGYLGRCVATLQGSPDAVLCQTHMRIIDGEGRPIGYYDGGLTGAESPDRVSRFAALIFSRHLCTDIFGVMRSVALRRVGTVGDYYGSDRATLAALGLIGRFVHVPEPLFLNREHAGRLSRALNPLKSEPGVKTRAARAGPPTWELHRDYRRAVRELVENEEERRRCRILLIRWWFRDWNWARITVDLIGAVYPAIYGLVHRLKLRLYGPLPQIDR